MTDLADSPWWLISVTVLAALPFRKGEQGAATETTQPKRNAPAPRFKPDQ